MNELKLIKSAEFGEIPCDFYGKDNEIYMTSEQLGECLEYSDPIRNVSKLVSRNEYLKEKQFSTVVKLTTVDGKERDVRIFTEDGIYEVTMLSKTEKAKEFRAWVRGILKALRSGKAKLIGMTEYQQMMARTRAENTRIRKAQILTRLADKYEGTTYQQVLNAHATKELTGDFLLPLPKLEAKTYSAGEIGDILGITANKVGILANRHNLKVDEYGEWFKDKAKGCNKEVPTFRYFENVIPVLRGIIAQTA